MDGKGGLILWVLAGTGVLLMYSAYKNANPQAVLVSHLTNTPLKFDGAGDGGAVQNARVTPGKVQAIDYSGGGASPAAGAPLDYLYDAHGTIAGTVPVAYATAPQTYVPPGGMYV